MDTGWIKIHRKILEWEWWNDIPARNLFMYCLFRANHEDIKWKGIKIKRGEFVTSLESLSNGCGFSIQNIRTALTKLESTGELTSRSTSKYRIIKVNNYDDHQAANRQTNKQLTNNQQTTNKQLTTDKELKNEKNIRNKEIYMCKASFDTFWELYPNKKDKKKAREKFIKLKKESLPGLLEAIKRQKRTEQWRCGIIPLPSTWINGERWNDTVEQKSSSKEPIWQSPE